MGSRDRMYEAREMETKWLCNLSQRHTSPNYCCLTSQVCNRHLYLRGPLEPFYASSPKNFLCAAGCREGGWWGQVGLKRTSGRSSRWQRHWQESWAPGCLAGLPSTHPSACWPACLQILHLENTGLSFYRLGFFYKKGNYESYYFFFEVTFLPETVYQA